MKSQESFFISFFDRNFPRLNALLRRQPKIGRTAIICLFQRVVGGSAAYGDDHLDVVLVEDEDLDGRLAWFENSLHLDAKRSWAENPLSR
jgi:hypothetical protein